MSPSASGKGERRYLGEAFSIPTQNACRRFSDLAAGPRILLLFFRWGAHRLIRVEPLKDLREYLFHEGTGICLLEEMSGFFFEYEKCEPLQGSHATQQVGGIVERIEVHIGFAVGGEDSATQPLSGLRGFGIAGIIPIYEIVANHQPEVTGMIENECNIGETQSARIFDRIARVSGFVDIAAQSLERQEGHFGQQPFCASKMMRWRPGRNAGALGRRAQREGLNAPFGDDVVGGFDESGTQVAMMVARSLSRHSPELI